MKKFIKDPNAVSSLTPEQYRLPAFGVANEMMERHACKLARQPTASKSR